MIQWQVVRSRCGAPTTALSFQNVFITSKEHSVSLYPVSNHSSSSHFLICFLSLHSQILDISSKTNHVVSYLLHLACVTERVFKVHPGCGLYQYFNPFHGWITSHCMDVPPLVCLFIHWWTFELFPLFDFYETSCASFCADICSRFSWTYAQEWNCWVIWSNTLPIK